MKFRLVETLDTENTEEFLRSLNLEKQLLKKFGVDYHEQPICKEVCEYVQKLSNNNEVTVITNFQVWVNSEKDGFQLVSNNGHYVIMYKDRIYDYTSDQYSDYGVHKVNGLRILTRTTADFMNQGIVSDDVDCYISDNYVIVVSKHM